jgi:hypothetical protein
MGTRRRGSLGTRFSLRTIAGDSAVAACSFQRVFCLVLPLSVCLLWVAVKTKTTRIWPGRRCWSQRDGRMLLILCLAQWDIRTTELTPGTKSTTKMWVNITRQPSGYVSVCLRNSKQVLFCCLCCSNMSRPMPRGSEPRPHVHPLPSWMSSWTGTLFSSSTWQGLVVTPRRRIMWVQ